MFAKIFVMKPAQIINPIITKVTFPIMSTIQSDTKQLKNIYLKTINYLCSVNFPIYMAIAILSEPLVLVLFGDKWHESIAIMQILALYFMFRSIGNPIGSLQLAKGRADLGFYWNLGLLLLIPIVIYVGSFYGLIGIALSLLGLQVFLNVPSWYFMVRPLCEAGFYEYFKQIFIPMITAVIASIFGFMAYYFIPVNDLYIRSLIFLSLASLAYLSLLKLYNNNLYSLLLNFLKKIKKYFNQVDQRPLILGRVILV